MTKSKFGKPLCRSIMAVAIMMLSLQAMAYNFTYTYQGKTLYYYVTSGSTIKVTYYSSISDFNNYVNGDVVIPSTVTYNGTTYSVTSIGKSAFSGCSSLTSVTIPNSVTSIGISAFSDCSGLTSITIPNSVTSIGKSAFSDCSSLTSVTIPNSVTSIGGSAFLGCIGLTSVTIPNSVTSIRDNAFYGCSGLTSVTIPNSVTSIGENAFSGCSGLTSVTIPTGVTSIGVGVFSNCSDLTSINVASGNTHYSSIDGVLYNCVQDTLILCPEAKTLVTIPNSVTAIGDQAFAGCRGLTSVTIPNSVTSIGDWAFYVSGLTSVTIGNGVTSIGDRAFMFCSSLTSVTIGDNVTAIGDWAFYNCYRLTSIIIPNNVTTIGNLAFSGCQLYSITIGNNVTTIGNSAFSGFSGFDSISVRCSAAIPPSLDSICFNYSPSSLIYTLTVPCGSLDAYELSDWNIVFAGHISEELPFELNVSVNVSTFGSIAISAGESCNEKIITATPESCYRFVAWNDGNTNNPRTIRVTQDTTLTANFERAVYTQEIHHAICEGSVYTENGFNANEAGTYTQNLQTVNGCDSIVTLTLTVNPIENTTLSAAICEGSTYTENGFNVSDAGTYTQNLQTINGCDSIVTLNLTVNPVENTTLSAAICEGSTYTENGFNASEAGIYTQNLQTVNGCDSIVTLTLTVNPVESTNLTAAICEGTTYTENGFNASEAGSYTQTLQTINGCDSIVTLNLTINPIESTNLTAAICEGSSYTENGFNASEAGTYTQNLQTINGCDSIVTLTLTVNPVENTNLSAAICEGSVYTENGFNASEAGTYTQNLQTFNGCDSVVTLTLTVNPVESTNLTAAICEGGAYTENGFNVSEVGTYTQNLQTINGCDSIVTLNLTVNPTYNITIDASINEGETYEENGFSESEAGTYVHTLQSEFGCDSVITLNLTVNSSLNDVVANAIEVSLYPNPANAYTTLKVEGLKEETPIYLFDIQGRKLKEYIMNIGQETLRIDLGDLPKGVYTIMLGNTTKKLIVE